MKKIYSLMLLGALLLLGAGNAWGTETFRKVDMYYSFNDTETHYEYYPSDKDASQTLALGTLTSTFEITKMYMMVYDNWGSTFFYEAQLNYFDKIDLETVSNYNLNWENRTTKGYDGNYQFEKTGLEIEIASSEDPSGNYTFTHWFWAKGWNTDHDQYSYINNNADNQNEDYKNYKFTYTILPPNVNSFGVTGSATSGFIGGTGTEDDPFLVTSGTNLVLTPTGSQAHTDANSALKIKCGETTGDTYTISSVTNTDVAYVDVQGYYYNSTASLEGAKTDTKRVYYKVPSTYALTVTSALYATLYLPYSVAIPSGVTAYYEQGYDETSGVVATFKAISTNIPALTPVVIRATTANSYDFVQVAKESAIDGRLEHFIGVTESTAKGSLGTGTPFVIAEGTHGVGFYVLADTKSVAANRCYYLVPDGVSLGAPRMRILDETGNTTDIPFFVEEKEFDANAPIFTILGQPVKDISAPGVYIQSGKKFVVK